MSKEKRYAQCLLKKGDQQQVAWIPLPFARKGKTIVIKDDPNWKVEEVYFVGHEEAVREYAHFYDHYSKIRGLPSKKE
jgi:hypothetical protein